MHFVLRWLSNTAWHYSLYQTHNYRQLGAIYLPLRGRYVRKPAVYHRAVRTHQLERTKEALLAWTQSGLALGDEDKRWGESRLSALCFPYCLGSLTKSDSGGG